jgi:hypothetical protein
MVGVLVLVIGIVWTIAAFNLDVTVSGGNGGQTTIVLEVREVRGQVLI